MKSKTAYELMAAMIDNDKKYLDARVAGDLEAAALLDQAQALLQVQLDHEMDYVMTGAAN